MAKNELKELQDVVEKLRASRFAQIDPVFVKDVLKAEQENPDDEAQALQGIENALKKMLSRKGA
jgi:hypothetical protein